MIFNLKLFCHFWKDLKQCARVPQREMTEKPLSKWLEPPAKLRDNLKQHAVTRWVINYLPRRFHNYLPSCLHLDYKVHRSKYPLICLIIVIIIVVEVFLVILEGESPLIILFLSTDFCIFDIFVKVGEFSAFSCISWNILSLSSPEQFFPHI